MNALQTTGLDAILNELRAIHLKNNVPSQLYLGFHRRHFLKIHTPHSPCMRYKQWKLGWYRSVIKDTLLGEQCALSTVCWLPLEGSPWKFIPRILRACATKRVSLLVFLLQSWALYLEGNMPSGLISASIRGIFLKIRISHFPRMRNGIWVAIGQQLRTRYLDSNAPFRQHPLQGFSSNFIVCTHHTCATNRANWVAIGQ